ncbi:MAG: glutamine--fructose-6-phosphate transaminase (isomerizing) [Patescibacteria group bacterium]|nr:glutamine--fructose-6-phosphate transaminase (isomerizing) [Patescibacteria group bacterium]
MCGIVGYIGKKEVLPILLDGLSRLEYRGYDSAGVAIVNGGGISTAKAKGRIAALKEKIEVMNLKGQVGIAHTRWATHGEPSERNAHPHFDCKGKIAVVHNGIIENFSELRKTLISLGHVFASDTDSEVLAHLIEKFYDENLGEAVRRALRSVRGTYGIAVVASDQPNVIIAARRGSPLVLGVGEKEYYLASDISAILSYTNKIVYPEDGEMIRISREGYTTLTLDNKFIERTPQEVEWSADDIEKGDFAHYMLKEIFEQPQVVRNTTAGRLLINEGSAHFGGLNLSDNELRMIDRILFVACGTAYYAGFVGKYMLEEVAGIPVDICTASEFRYKRILITPTTLVFVVSQSGETADTLAALREVKRKGNKVLGITNVVSSTIARETDGGIFIHAGPEIGVASTKAFMGQITTLALMALNFGRIRDLSASAGKKMAEAISRIPAQIEGILSRRGEIKEIAEKYKDAKSFLFMGRKFNFPIALEGALKLKEITYIHAEGYAAGEMKHGPIALVDKETPSVFICPKDTVYEKTISNISEVRARNGRVIAIATEGDEQLKQHVDDIFYIPRTPEAVAPLLTTVPLQLFAYYTAVAKNLDVDKPRNLAKSVTVE